jgi:hypothetical protein
MVNILEQEIEKAIRSTLIVLNKQSIPIAIGKIMSVINEEVPMKTVNDKFLMEYNVTSCCNEGPITRENYCPNCGKKIKKAP